MLSLGPRPISSPPNWKSILGRTKLLLPCFLQLPCGTWPASFRTAQHAAGLKNNSMRKCSALFLRVTRLAPPMSRRQVTNRRESLLPPLIPDRHQRVILFDTSAAPGPPAAINGKAGEPPGGRTRHNTHYCAAKQASQTIEVAISDLIAGNHLLARLMLRRIRSHNRSGVIGGQSCSSDEPRRARASITTPDMASPVIGDDPVPPASAPVPAMETLFTQLARRRLRGRATDETR